jgi:histidinol-phosphate/aromatic aminotransferase/cobyric acid decarboxylase-like protein
MSRIIKIALAAEANRSDINHIRHEIYAIELQQFPTQSSRTLKDRSNVKSQYITAFENDTLVGFVGITPPDSPSYSIDHYVKRADVPIPFDNHLFEIRALTVINPSRGSMVAATLMYAAFRWIQAHGGKNLVAIGHQKVKSMYLRLGMRPTGNQFPCGNLKYELLTAPIDNIETELTRFNVRINRLKRQIDWQLEIPFLPPIKCYHGGAFFNAIGNTFDDLTRYNKIINADVLDAWFPPCPESQQALHEHLGWIMRTSPPNHAEGLVKTIAKARGIKPDNILASGGSSPLIFLAFRHWLTPASKVLLLNPTYGEYSHVLEKVVGCKVEYFKLHREDGYVVDTERLAEKLKEGFDQIVWVNPNSPTGRHVARSEVEKVLEQCPPETRVWIDETYVEYAGEDESLESYAAQSKNVVIVKSMSKVYGFSGLRVGYLCGAANVLEPLRGITPPWSVSLPAQIAAIKALKNPEYYIARHGETHQLRAQLVQGLKRLGIIEIIPSIANFILFHLPESGSNGDTFIKRCRENDLFIRDASEMGSDMGDRAIRIAVKDATTNKRMLRIIESVLHVILHKKVLCN